MSAGAIRTRVPLPRGSAAHEREADVAAAQVLAAPDRAAPLRCACGGGCSLCRPAATPGFQHPGTPLPDATRRWFEPRFGADFGAVRVHADERAARAAEFADAAAYTWGTHIVFGRGQWQPDGTAGRRLLAHELAHVVQQAGSAPRLQRAALTTAFGKFESDQVKAEGNGMTMQLTFDPDPAKCDATKIALVQAVRYFNSGGKAMAANPTIAAHMAPAGKPGAGYAIDASGETNNPLYFDLPDVAAGKGLGITANTQAPLQDLGTGTHFIFGHSYVPAGQKAKVTQKAGLFDHPEGIRSPGYGMAFETSALAIEGHDAGSYYGSVTWGYKVDASSKPQPQDIAHAANAPGAAFTAAAAKWNAGTARGTIVVNPTAGGNKASAWVQYTKNGSGQPKRQPAGTKLRYIKNVTGSAEPMIEAELLDAAGNGTGVEVQIYVSDTLDQGGGRANAPLP